MKRMFISTNDKPSEDILAGTRKRLDSFIAATDIFTNSKIISADIDAYYGNRVTIKINYYGLELIMQEEDNKYSIYVWDKSTGRYINAAVIYPPKYAHQRLYDLATIAEKFIDNICSKLGWKIAK